MREMKDSGIEWIGEIPKDWEVQRVKHIFNRKNKKARQEIPIVLSLARNGVRQRDITNNEGQIAESYYNYNVVDIGDLLINPMDLYSGANCSISYINGVISPAYINLVAKKGSNSRYYDYYFKLQYWLMAFFSYGKGVSFENRWTLNTETLMNYPVICPTYDIQERIANYLDEKCFKIDEIIAKEETNIKLLEGYKQAITNQVVTRGLDSTSEIKSSHVDWIEKIPSNWQKKRLKQVFKFGKGLPITKANLEDNGVPVISYGQIHSKQNRIIGMSQELIRYVNHSYITSNNGSLVKLGDFIFADTSEDLAGCGNNVYINTNEKTFAGYHTIILRSQRSVDNRYFGYLFSTDCWRSQIRKRVSGIKLLSITQKILKETTIIYPPIKEQIEIASYLDIKIHIINEIVAKKHQLIEKCTEYKKSLIYEVVTGKKEV